MHDPTNFLVPSELSTALRECLFLDLREASMAAPTTLECSVSSVGTATSALESWLQLGSKIYKNIWV